MLTRIRRLTSRIGAYYTRTVWKAFLALTAIAGTAIVAVAIWQNLSATAAIAFAGTATVFLLLIGGTPTAATQARPRPAAQTSTTNGKPKPGDLETVGESPRPAVVATEPTVTVIVAARNETRFIVACLESVASQTYRDFECLVIDDGSTDDTVDRVIDRFAPDQRFRFFSNERSLGLAAVRNQGIDLARGEFITFLDGDDLLYPDSVACRVAPLQGQIDPMSWIAGTYCDWRPVPEMYELEASPKSRKDRSRVTWFDALTDAPFIASAPLLRTGIVRALGGFKTELVTAEDAFFWNALLRSGYVIDYVASVGVAYRQKQHSMFRETTELHARTVAKIVASNFEDLGPAMFTPGAPHPYWRAAGGYLATMTLFQRLITGLAIAVQSGSTDQVEAAVGAAEGVYEPYLEWVLDLPDLVSRATRRATLPLGEVNHRGGIGHTVDNVLSRIVAAGRSRNPAARRGSAGPLGNVGTHSPTQLRSVTKPAGSADGARVADRVVLCAAAGYHVVELEDMATALRRSGVEAIVLVPPQRWSQVAPFLRRWDGTKLIQAEAGEWITQARAVVTLNDWGLTGAPVRVANANGIPTFGKVEGVQDFRDDDVRRVRPEARNAYQTVRSVLAQGRNDADALPEQQTHIVGSTRLERMWLAPPRPYRGDLVVINVNFTYGILDAARETWLNSVVLACDRMRMPYVLSLHPAETDRYAGRFPIADQPVRHLLTEASVLISRFSTVPFEAMARGVPFIYHNPHGEKVPTFKEPNGAFEISHDARSLTDALGESTKWVSNYRDRAGDFFLRQVDVDPSHPSGIRSAEVILSAII